MFLVSNILPERPHLNREAWKGLERLKIRDYAQRFDEIWVANGPIFGDGAKRLGNGVQVPAACYKILVDEENGQTRLLAFIIPQDVAGSESLAQFLTNVDAVERGTGFDFFSDLPDELEDRLEAEPAKGLW